MSLISIAPQIVAGSALAGFGSSFGRDVYRRATKTGWRIWLFIVFFVIVVMSLVGSFFTGLWIGRNYENFLKGLIVNIFSLTLFLLLVGILWSALALPFVSSDLDATETFGSPKYVSEFLVNLLASEFGAVAWFLDVIGINNYLAETASNLRQETRIDALVTASATVALSHLLFFAGLIKGIFQRSKRRNAWEAEISNKAFLEGVGLTEIEEEMYTDAEGITYRFNSASPDRIVLFAVGRRNKRAYLEFDETGKYVSWSGLVSF